MTGDPDEDSVTMEYDRPSRQEVASVIALAARLYLGGAGAPRRYFAWGQAVRLAVLAVLLVHAAAGLDGVVSVFLPGTHQIFPAPPATIVTASPGGVWPPAVWYLVGYAWIVIYVALVLGHYRAARVAAMLAIVPTLAWLLQGQSSWRWGPSRTGSSGSWCRARIRLSSSSAY